MIKILVVGQTPPPYGGQAIMTTYLLKGEYNNNLQLFHVRLTFSKEMDDIGKIQLSKFIKLIYTILQIIYLRFRNNINVLYFSPAGQNKIPMYRDFAILISTRWLFKKTIFHFHAGGISNLYEKLSGIVRFFFKKAYFNPDVAIRLSELNPEDGKILKAKREYIIPNGIENYFDKFCDNSKEDTIANILFVSVLRESKGLLVLLEAISLLVQKKLNFRVNIIGKFESIKFEELVYKDIERFQIKKYINFLGVRVGHDKFKIFSESDILCYPTFFESETFGIVILEAMSFCLPVVATQWRGIPSIVKDGVTGYLVPIKDAELLADKLEILISNPQIAKNMGQKGREVYLQKYTIDTFHKNIESAFLSLV